MRAVQITEFGGPEVLTLTELPDPEPTTGFAVLDVSRIGVNYADTHHVENSGCTSSVTLSSRPGSVTSDRSSRPASIVRRSASMPARDSTTAARLA